MMNRKLSPTAQKTGELLANGNFASGLSPWTMEENGATGKAEVVPEGPDGQAALRVTVVTVGDASWRLQIHHPVRIKKGQKYALTYWIKAERPGVITVNCMQNHAPWEHHGAAAEVPVTTKWTPMRFNFDGPWDDTNARITFTNLGTTPGQVYWFASVSLKEIPGAKRVDKKPALPQKAVLRAGTPTGGALHVVGNHLEDTKGRVVRLQGVNVPSLDWSPTGEHLMPSLDAALGTWNAKVIRIPLTQDLWFGYYKGARAQDQGRAYRKLVDSVVKKIASKNAYVLLDLHWSDCGQWGQNVGQHAMPDDNSVLFWKDCAARYANHPAVLFDLYNEPHSVSWSVWKNGGEVVERKGDQVLRYRTPGMQALLDTVRSTGAKNLVVAGGLDWAYDLRGIIDGHALVDRKGGRGVLYGTHLYPWKKDWDANVTPVATRYPVFVGEVGTKPWKQGDPPHENVYTESWAPEVIAYITKYQLSWTAWSFHPSANPCLITGWDYQPTAYWGTYVKTALKNEGQQR